MNLCNTLGRYLSPLRARSFLVAVGNHDVNYEDNGTALLALANLTQRFYERVLQGGDGASLQLIVLDSNCLAYPKRADAVLAAQQAAFLAQKLGEGSFTYRVVSFHHPVHSCARHKSTLRSAPETENPLQLPRMPDAAAAYSSSGCPSSRSVATCSSCSQAMTTSATPSPTPPPPHLTPVPPKAIKGSSTTARRS